MSHFNRWTAAVLVLLSLHGLMLSLVWGVPL